MSVQQTCMEELGIYLIIPKRNGIECRFVDPTKPEEFENAIDDKTAVFTLNTSKPKIKRFPY